MICFNIEVSPTMDKNWNPGRVYAG